MANLNTINIEDQTMKVLIFRMLISTLFTLFYIKIGFASEFTYLPKDFSDTLEKQHKKSEAEIHKKARDAFKKWYPNFKILEVCTGSFRISGAYEYALAIINPDTLKYDYIVLWQDNKNKITSASLIPDYHRLKKPAEGLYLSPADLGVQCFSAMGIKRLNNTIKTNPLAGTDGELTPINFYDSICMIAGTSGHTHNNCYSYDQKKKKFVYIGGWVT
jgi:hypothetical protein